MYSDTARRPSSPYSRHRQFGLKKTSDISERVSVHSVELDEAEAGRIKTATVSSSARALEPLPRELCEDEKARSTTTACDGLVSCG